MSTNSKNILLIINSELKYNRLLIILPIILLILIYIVLLVSTIIFNIDEPIYFISPVLIIGAITLGIWTNRIKEQRESIFTKLPVNKTERAFARISTYLILIILLFLIYLFFDTILYSFTGLLKSTPISEMFLVLIILGLSLIVQDFRYCIKQKYERYWIPATLVLILFITSPFIIMFIETLFHIEQVVINNVLLAIYGTVLLSLSIFFYNSRNSFFD